MFCGPSLSVEEALAAVEFPRALRAILLSDQSVTETLGRLSGLAVEVRILKQEFEQERVVREALLIVGDRPAILARSIFPYPRSPLSPRFWARIREGRDPIGALLTDEGSRFERREVSLYRGASSIQLNGMEVIGKGPLWGRRYDLAVDGTVAGRVWELFLPSFSAP